MPETYADPTFEARLGPWITDLGETTVRPFDATAIARAAAGAQAGRVRVGRSWGTYAADRRLVWVALTALLAVLALALVVGIAGRPTTTPKIGRLAYTLDGDLYLANWDGSQPRAVQLPGVDSGATPNGVAWARSGRALAVGVTASDGHASIVILDPDGSVMGRIDLGITDETTPLIYQWSPTDDILAVAIDMADSVSISTYRADGAPVTTEVGLPQGLTFRPWGSLDWAPSGDRFVVTGCLGCVIQTKNDEPGPDASGGLWIVQADGSGSTAYLPETSASSLRAAYEAVWSPTGDRIAFAGGCVRYDQDCTSSGVWTMRPDGSGLARVTTDAGPLLPAIWSPDGSHLVLMDHSGCVNFAEVTPTCPSPHDSGLAVVDVASGAVALLNEGRGQDSPVAWPGDGSLIMFDRSVADTASGEDVPEVWAIRADGTAPAQRLVHGTADAAWQWLPPAAPEPTTNPTTAPKSTQRPPSPIPSPRPSDATTRDGLLALLEGGTLVLKNADLTDRVQIPGMTTSADDTSLVSVAPDLRHVAARTGRGVAIVATDDSAAKPVVADVPSGQTMEFAWDPTGRMLGIFSDADPHHITLVTPDGTRSGSIDLPAGFTQEQMGKFGLSWSHDGVWIALEGCDQTCAAGRWPRALLVAADGTGSHWLIDQTAKLTALPLGGSETAISWNPDGRVAVGIYCHEEDLWCAAPYDSRVEVYDATGRRLQRFIVPDRLIPDALAWSNDGSRLAVAAWRGGPGGAGAPSRLLLLADDGSTTDVRTGLKLPAGIIRIRWAPGDDRLWVTGVDTTLVTIDLQGSTQGEAAPNVLGFDFGVAPSAGP